MSMAFVLVAALAMIVAAGYLTLRRRMRALANRVGRILATLTGEAVRERTSPAADLDQRLDRLAAAVESIQHRVSRRHRTTGLQTREPLLHAMQNDLAGGAGGVLAIFEFRDFDRLSGFDPVVADRAIAVLGERIGRMVGDKQLVSQIDRARLGLWFGDSNADSARSEIEAIRYALSDAIALGDQEILPEIVAGAAAAPDSGNDPEGLLAAAIATLAGGAGEDGPAVERARDTFELEQDLRRAVVQGEFALEYQPLIDADEERICGAEALIRWHHPSRGVVMPGVFIPVVERAGLAGDVGMWALNTACRQVRQWRGKGIERFRVAVNLSAHQLRHDDLPAMIQRTMSRHALEPGMLEIELTETVAAGDVLRAKTLFTALRELGVAIAIDDFGTGYSSLSYLRQLSFDKLKIDREFVTEVDTRPASQAICQSLIALGRGLGIQVLAEGVERGAEYDWLRQHGCVFFQGFHFARPMAADRLSELVLGDALAGRIAASPTALQDRIRQRMTP